ncbi:hypothetical protein GCM10017589_56460 [Streptomyces poonensis]|nr:hypothetical protein GCM10017589_56460 [Streptomyces poonensis]
MDADYRDEAGALEDAVGHRVAAVARTSWEWGSRRMVRKRSARGKGTFLLQ